MAEHVQFLAVDTELASDVSEGKEDAAVTADGRSFRTIGIRGKLAVVGVSLMLASCIIGVHWIQSSDVQTVDETAFAHLTIYDEMGAFEAVGIEPHMEQQSATKKQVIHTCVRGLTSGTKRLPKKLADALCTCAVIDASNPSSEVIPNIKKQIHCMKAYKHDKSGFHACMDGICPTIMSA